MEVGNTEEDARFTRCGAQYSIPADQDERVRVRAPGDHPLTSAAPDLPTCPTRLTCPIGLRPWAASGLRTGHLSSPW
jgi:hypothetical protein